MKHLHACLSFRIVLHPVAIAPEPSSSRPNNKNSDNGETRNHTYDGYDGHIPGVTYGICCKQLMFFSELLKVMQ